MENNIINVSSKDEQSIKKAIQAVTGLFDKSIQSAVFSKEIYAGSIKDTVDKFTSLGCPFILPDKFGDTITTFKTIKQQYANIVLVE